MRVALSLAEGVRGGRLLVCFEGRVVFSFLGALRYESLLHVLQRATFRLRDKAEDDYGDDQIDGSEHHQRSTEAEGRYDLKKHVVYAEGGGEVEEGYYRRCHGPHRGRKEFAEISPQDGTKTDCVGPHVHQHGCQGHPRSLVHLQEDSGAGGSQRQGRYRR